MSYSPENLVVRNELRKRGPKSRPLSERFWEKVAKAGEDECWLWQGATGNGTRPPEISDQGKNLIAYRVAFEESYRPLEKDEWVMHTCDNPCCMNPKHLCVGDRIAWAQKWHGVVYDQAHHEVLSQRTRDRARARYVKKSDEIRTKNTEYQMRNKIKAVNYLGGKCSHCGFDHPSALQFHHRDPATKAFGITSKELSTPKKRPWDTVIVPELDKCVLLCSNCHFLEHSVLHPSRVRELQKEL